jgi:chromosome segregation ATPase
MSMDTGVGMLLAVLVLSGGAGFVLAWKVLGGSLGRLRMHSERLQAAITQKEQALARTLARCDELEAELGGLHAKLGEDETRIGQLRDLIKAHVARRSEFEAWAAPIRACLGESVGHTVRSLKEQIAQQEFALNRQAQRVAAAEAHFRDKQGELEGMRRELTLKNYHIAALNERFIRVEERMHELTTQVAAIGSARAGARASPEREGAAAASGTLPVPETERFTAENAEARDWMQVLDDWHRQLHDRLDRMDELQSQLKAGGDRPGGARGTAARGPGAV